MALAHARTTIVGNEKYQWKTSGRGGLHLAIFHPKTQTKWIVRFKMGQSITPRVVREEITRLLVKG